MYKKWKNNKFAFTLAETTILLIVLGTLALLTIPGFLAKHAKAHNKVKVKRAVALYERALSHISIDNKINSDAKLISFANGAAACANTRRYFPVQSGNGCLFKTKDGIWWDITDIQRVVIYLKKEGITPQNRDRIIQKANNLNDTEAFVLIGRFNNNTLRVNDLAFETANDFNGSRNLLEKLYGYLNDKVVSVVANNDVENPIEEECGYVCRYNRGDFSQFCTDTITTNCSACK